MSDSFYAVQYQNRNGHRIAIFSLEDLAEEFLKYLKENEARPYGEFYEQANFVDDIAVDFYNLPSEYKGVQLAYVGGLMVY